MENPVKILSNYRFQILFAVTVILYVLVYAPYGFTEGDDGFITALSWRVYNGQIPYIDFIYVRPPLTLLLHTLPFVVFPHDIVVISERVLFFISLAVSSYFGTKSVILVFEEELNGVDTFSLLTLIFIYSVNSFTPMAWHTVDGVLFGSAGIYLLISGKTWSRTGVGIFFLFLSALTKQSFYLMPFIGLIYILIRERSVKKAAFASIFLLIPVLVFIASMLFSGMWTEFILQTTSETNISDLYTAGVYTFLHTPVIYFVIPVTLFLFLRVSKSGWVGRFLDHMPVIFVGFAYLYSLAFYINRLFFKDMSMRDYYRLEYVDPVPTVLFICSVIYLTGNWDNKKILTGLGLMLTLAWSSAISWAHFSPHLYSAPLVIIPVLAGVKYFKAVRANFTIGSLIVTGMLVYFLAYFKPYNSDSRAEIVYELENVAPSLKYIWGDQRIYSMLQEVAVLRNKYPGPATILPAMPLGDFFIGQVPILPIDWHINGETAGKSGMILDVINNRCKYVFIDAEWLDIERGLNDDSRRFSSDVTINISKKWKLMRLYRVLCK